MNRLKLFNLSHEFSAPAAEDKPIFLPFGTWAYDGKISQTFTREAAARIANELAADVAAGNPGIPVYQGHPDVPSLAAKYPDKGALGWVKRIDLSNEGCSLTVDWDRFPGKGFGWFSPYWFGEKTGLDNQGKTLVAVDHIESIGLVNNPNIQEFRLANEDQPEERKTMKPYQLPQRIIDLANEYDESKHPRADDGKFTSVGGSGGGEEKVITITGDEDWMGEMPKIEQTPENRARNEAAQMLRKTKAYRSASVADKDRMLDTETKRVLRKNLYTSLEKKVGSGMAVELFRTTGLSEIDVYGDPAKVERAAHRAALLSGLKYNHGTRSYS